MTRLLLTALIDALLVGALCLLASGVRASESATWSGQTEASIHPTTEPGAVAEVRFYNAPVNDGHDTGETAVITLGDISVALRFQWNDDGDADRIDADPGPELIAVPQFLTVPENGSGRILIYPREGLGF
jgi:hypothetical protein